MDTPPALPNIEAPKNVAPLQNNAAAALAKEAFSAKNVKEAEPTNWSKVSSEVVGTLSGGTAGTVAWALATKQGMNLPVKIGLTALSSGLSRTVAQGGMERALLTESERTSASHMFGWGMVDGFAGVAGVAAEARATKILTPMIGRKFLGPVGDETAMLAGRKALEGSLACKFQMNTVRGVSGGLVGGFTWSAPHELHGHFFERKDATWTDTLDRIKMGTLLSGAAGGLLASTITGVANAGDLFENIAAKLGSSGGVKRVDILHFNDLHSAVVGEQATLPQLATRIKEIRAASTAQGRTSFVYEGGDNFSGNVAAGFTDTGYVETKAVNMLHPDAFVPGNHVADAGNGGVNIDGWYKNLQQISAELGRELPAVGSNIVVTKHPNFIGPTGVTYKPYRIVEYPGLNGQPEKVGIIGLVTHELLEVAKTGEIKYIDAKASADQWIKHLRAPVSEGGQGVKQVHVLSHLGRSSDLALARDVPGITYIVSAHSHDAEPVLLWARNMQTGWDVPIMQAGHSGKWLAHTDLAVKANGAADRFRSTGKLIPIGKDVVPDQEIKTFIDRHVAEVAKLEAHKYPVQITEAFSMTGVRGQLGTQTPLGSLVSEAALTGVNRRLPALNAERATQGLEPIQPISIYLKHTGDIRNGLEAGTPSHRAFSDVFLNTGTVERETGELTAVVLKGADIEKVLNFGVSDLPRPSHLKPAGNALDRARNDAVDIFFGPKPEPISDYSGNFVQTQGLRYSLDLSKTTGQRVRAVQVLDPATNTYGPIDPNREYSVLTLFHPVEKWAKNGVFGPEVQAGGEAAARAYTKAQPVPLSQVELLAEHAQMKGTLSPADYQSTNITNLTPPKWNANVRPRLSTLGGITVEAAERE